MSRYLSNQGSSFDFIMLLKYIWEASGNSLRGDCGENSHHEIATEWRRFARNELVCEFDQGLTLFTRDGGSTEKGSPPAPIQRYGRGETGSGVLDEASPQIQMRFLLSMPDVTLVGDFARRLRLIKALIERANLRITCGNTLEKRDIEL